MIPRGPILLTLLWACGQEQVVPELPELRLVPGAEELERILDQAPTPPDLQRMDVLRDLMETAFFPGLVNQRLAGQARDSLLEEEDAFWILEQGLEHGNAMVRSNAAYQLGQLGSHPALLPLLLRLKYEQDPGVVIWLADATARLDNHTGLPQLNNLMMRAETANAAGLVAIDILKSVGRDPGDGASYDALVHSLGELHREWLETGVVGEPGEPGVLTRGRFARHLLDLMGFQLRPVDEARFVLARAGELPLPLLRLAVTAEEAYLRIHALEVVIQLGRVALPLAEDILPLLGDPLSATTAVQALGAVGALGALPHLLGILSGPDLELRIAAAGALGPLGEEDAVPVLHALVADQNEPMDLRINAAFSLALLEDGETGRAFLQKCQDQGLYHASTVAELLEKLESAKR